jgi:hypothetical protein
MLKIAERIFLSPELKIDDIIKSKFGGEDITADRFRTHRALIKGEYDRFSERENEYISNLFQTNAQRPGPPLLGYYILWILRQKLNSARNDQDDNVENRHWLVADLCQLFEGCGVAEDFVMSSLNRLYDMRLIEALDPNSKHLSIADKVAIKDSGLAHLELILTSTVYVEQMALVTGLNELFARDEIRKNQQRGQFQEVREAFLRYILKIDAGRLTVPSNQLYAQIGKGRAQIEVLASQRRSINR